MLDLICDLIEMPRARIGASVLEARGVDAGRLVTMGLVRPGSAPRTVACRGCDEDHAATPVFDSVAGRYFHFCPVAGRVAIDPRDLETLEIRARAMVDLLVAAFPVLPTIGRELVPGESLALGRGRHRRDFAHADVRLSNWKPSGFRCAGESGRRGASVGNRNDRNEQSPTGSQLVWPNRYTVIGLRDIATVHEDRLLISQERVAAHIRMLRGNTIRLHAGGGRPSDESRTMDAQDRRRQRGEPFVSIAAETRAIISELAGANPDRAVPGVSTVRRHLGKLRSSQS